jgi:hypothetical protein
MEKQDTELALEGVHVLAAAIMIERDIVSDIDEYTYKYKEMIDKVIDGSRAREASHKEFMRKSRVVIDSANKFLEGINEKT